METANHFRVTPRLIVGLGIVAFGILWTLDNLGYLEAEQYLEWWPVILIVIGLVRLLDPLAGKAASFILLLVGGAFLLENLDLVEWDFFDLIPIFFVLLGAKLVWEAVRGRAGRRLGESDPNSSMNLFAMMAAVKRQSTSGEFRGGEATAIMGGVELDLRKAAIKDGEAIIDTFGRRLARSSASISPV